MSKNVLFSYYSGVITYKDGSNKDGSTTETNIGLINQDQLKDRFIADIIKDASIADGKIPKKTLNSIFQNCFLDYKGISNYETVLTELSDEVRANILKPNNEEILGNVFKKEQTVVSNMLKTSTVGSNIKISNATHILWESGFGAEELCIDPNFFKIGTPASILDSINKGPPTTWFPEKNNGILKFDEKFTERLGFPKGMTWECQTTNVEGVFNVTINYGNDELTGKVSLSDRGVFQKYCKGNKEKNAEINEMEINAKKMRITVKN